MKILVTGGLGFIGSEVIRKLINTTDYEVINLDKVSYASTFTSLQSIENSPKYEFKKIDLVDDSSLEQVFNECKPDAVMHLAAESHVDRSIDGPNVFVESNIIGTFNLLQAARQHDVSKFIHVSTDEVFGSLTLDEAKFNPETPYNPRSPYSATKASSDHLARAWLETFEVPVIVTNCSNNYGYYQFPEKMIPLMVIKAIYGDDLPVYGDGKNIRDWLFVEDHADALIKVLLDGDVGETYTIGGNNEMSNIDLVNVICENIDLNREKINKMYEVNFNNSSKDLIKFVEDRPGHDLRYAIDSSFIKEQLGWEPKSTLDIGIKNTVEWYINNQVWWEPLLEKGFMDRRGLVS